MRVIDCETLEFRDVLNPETIDYAIISHRWGNDEVSYHEMLHSRNSIRRRKGYRKIEALCEKAREQCIPYAWIDTCCIDKTNSVEHSGAINSMYRWYSCATVCFAYLGDVAPRAKQTSYDTLPKTEQASSVSDFDALRRDLAQSEWFRRAWTLQELISPRFVRFYDSDWNFIGNKQSLAPVLSEITNIPEDVLTCRVDFHHLTIAERMSWASNRQCARDEDVAYSLLGIFDIDMPLIYGEGTKAFQRLQKEIIKQTNDHTIFLWQTPACLFPSLSSSLFAPHPSCFQHSWRYRLGTNGRRIMRPYSVTNSGLSISLWMQPWLPGIYLGLLECEVSPRYYTDAWTRVGIFLRKTPQPDIYQRVVLCNELLAFPPLDTPDPMSRYLRVCIDLQKPQMQSHRGPTYGFKIRTIQLPSSQQNDAAFIMTNSDVFSMNSFNPFTRVVELPAGFSGTTAVISLNPEITMSIGTIVLGFDFDFQPVCIIGKDRMPSSLIALSSDLLLQGFNKIYWNFSDRFGDGSNYLNWGHFDGGLDRSLQDNIQSVWHFKGTGSVRLQEFYGMPSQVHRRFGLNHLSSPWTAEVNMQQESLDEGGRYVAWVVDIFINHVSRPVPESETSDMTEEKPFTLDSVYDSGYDDSSYDDSEDDMKLIEFSNHSNQHFPWERSIRPIDWGNFDRRHSSTTFV